MPRPRRRGLPPMRRPPHGSGRLPWCRQERSPARHYRSHSSRRGLAAPQCDGDPPHCAEADRYGPAATMRPGRVVLWREARGHSRARLPSGPRQLPDGHHEREHRHGRDGVGDEPDDCGDDVRQHRRLEHGGGQQHVPAVLQPDNVQRRHRQVERRVGVEHAEHVPKRVGAQSGSTGLERPQCNQLGDHLRWGYLARNQLQDVALQLMGGDATSCLPDLVDFVVRAIWEPVDVESHHADSCCAPGDNAQPHYADAGYIDTLHRCAVH